MLRKALLSAFALLLFSAIAQAQYEEGQKGYFSLNLGMAMPYGSFASTDINNRESGFASRGRMVGATVTNKFRGMNFGYICDGTISSIDANLGPIKDDLDETTGAQWTIKTNEPWTLYTVHLGLFYSFKIFNKLTFEPKVLGGMLISSDREVRISTPVVQGTFVTGYDYSPSSDISLQAGATIKYDISAHGAITVSGWILKSKPRIDYHTTAGLAFKPAFRDFDSYDQPIDFVGLTLGASYTF